MFRSLDNLLESQRLNVREQIPYRVKWLIISFAFSSLSIGYLIVYISAYMPETGFSPSSIGLLVGVFGMVPILTGLPLGILSDRKGRKWLLILGGFGIPPSLAIFALTRDIGLLIVSAVLLGLSEAAALTTWNAIIADQTTPETRNSAFSFSFIVSTIFAGIGASVPLFFPSLQNYLNTDSATIHQSSMVFFAGLSLVTPVALLFLLRGYVEVIRPKREKKPDSPRPRPWSGMRTLLKFSGINSLIGLGAGFIIPLIPTWFFLKFKVPDTYTGPLFAAASITIGLSAIGSARLAKRYGQVRAITLTTSISTVFMLSLAFVNNPFLAAGLYVVRAGLMNMAAPLMDSYLMGIITVEERGLASAINSIIWRLPNSISTIFGGILLESGRYDVPFFIAASLYAVSIVLFYNTFRDLKPQS